MDLISNEMWEKMPSKNDFYDRLRRLGIMDSKGNIDNERMLELESVPNGEMN